VASVPVAPGAALPMPLSGVPAAAAAGAGGGCRSPPWVEPVLLSALPDVRRLTAADAAAVSSTVMKPAFTPGMAAALSTAAALSLSAGLAAVTMPSAGCGPPLSRAAGPRRLPRRLNTAKQHETMLQQLLMEL
jgi:hypothetical protein